MAWTYLLIAGLLEIGWAVGLKYTHGFTKLWPTVGTLLGMFASVFFLTLAVRALPLGTAYTVWTGIGAVGAVILGIVLLGESAEPTRLLFVAVIVIGVVGLKVSAPASADNPPPSHSPPPTPPAGP